MSLSVITSLPTYIKSKNLFITSSIIAFGFGSSVGLSLLKGLGLPGFSGFLVGGGAVSGLVPGFGDGAGAIVLSASEDENAGDILAMNMHSEGKYAD